MTHRRPARTRLQRKRIRRRRAAGLLVIAAIAAALGHELPASSSSPSDLRAERRPALEKPERAVPQDAPVRRALGEDDGAVPDGATVFDDALPGVGNLDRELLAALRQAAEDAATDGVAFVVDSGWRSPEYQEHLLQEAVLKYGSHAEAARWVATPDTSAHVSGDAVDIGPAEATAWLSAHGAHYGLCQTYGNEPWHYELRPEAGTDGCPPMYADPTHDPRMQQHE